MWCEMAVGVSESSSAANLKLPRRAADSKAFSACNDTCKLNLQINHWFIDSIDDLNSSIRVILSFVAIDTDSQNSSCS